MSEAEPSFKVPHFLLRGLARVIDLMVQILIMEIGFRILPHLPVSGLVTFDDSVLFYIDVAVGCTVLVVYTTVSEWLGGATLGKAVFFLRVANANDIKQPISFRSALIRSAMFFVDGLFFGMFAYSHMARSRLRQRKGDVMANTVVVWASDGPDRSALRGWPMGMVGAVGILVLSYVITG